MTVDEILAMGEYTDRRFRLWELSKNTRTGEDCWMVWEPFLRRTELTPAQMRLLIERDMHRDECEGLRYCETHPVHFVLFFNFDRARYVVYRPHEYDGELDQFDVLSDAMDAANEWALEVGE